MFAGHAGLALAVRPLMPRQSLGLLFAAAFWLDLVWPVLLLTGLESVQIRPGDTAFAPLAFVHYPWSHSLLAVLAWAVAFALVALRGRLDRLGDFLGLSGLVLSHWFLDAVVHRPDLPLAPGLPPKVGLSLWNSLPATFLVEGLLVLGGILVYLRRTTAKDGQGTWAFVSLLALIIVIWASGPFSPPPPNPTAIGIVGLLSWLLPLWAFWADRHRGLRANAF